MSGAGWFAAGAGSMLVFIVMMVVVLIGLAAASGDPHP